MNTCIGYCVINLFYLKRISTESMLKIICCVPSTYIPIIRFSSEYKISENGQRIYYVGCVDRKYENIYTNSTRKHKIWIDFYSIEICEFIGYIITGETFGRYCIPPYYTYKTVTHTYAYEILSIEIFLFDLNFFSQLLERTIFKWIRFFEDYIGLNFFEYI